MQEQERQNKKAEAETLALLKKEAEMQKCDRWEVPLSELKSRQVCSPNFLTSIV
jgi:chromatin segregation and condensation protein Rec8/ScpA/Scc1 (kleisin family)